jgi:phenylalanyl-tRNA synthetase beta chain
VVTGHVVSVERHPNADRLSLCVVDDGSQKLSVVCGAKNVAAGQKIALARVGAVLPGGFTIARSKIRGIESHGMICSVKELGLGAQADGIWVMDPASIVGQDLAANLGDTDRILDVEFTPNRPDCLSHLGLARELAAFFNLQLKPAAAITLPAGALPCLDIRVEAKSACPRYVGRSFVDLNIGSSPGWLAAKLESVGLRPINALVDITNYLLLDIGQPLHAFDADTLEGGIVVRFAGAGEKIKALDEKEYALTERCLVIADHKKPVAVAGVMGGLGTGVTAKTKRAFLESACFDPAAVRRTSQALRLKSDASYRYERGTDPGCVESASRRAAELIIQLCGREVKCSDALDRSPDTGTPAPIVVTTARLNEILGSEIPAGSVETVLKSISARFDKAGDELKVTPPSYRRDMTSAWDLAEDVARLVGYDNIPYRMPSGVIKPAHSLPAPAIADRVRQRLAALGLYEAYNYDFISDKLAAQARLDAPMGRVQNPLSEEYAALRPTLLVGLLKNATLNLNNGAETVRLFEIGKTYHPGSGTMNETARGRPASGPGGPALESGARPSPGLLRRQGRGRRPPGRHPRTGDAALKRRKIRPHCFRPPIPPPRQPAPDPAD